MIRKMLKSCIAATSLIFFSTQAFALINFSVGVPLSHTFSSSDIRASDGVSGTFIQIGIPILPGLGMDNYETKLKDSDTKIGTTMYNLYYLLPIPVINLTIGAGVGSTEVLCATCSTYYDKGGAVQGYASLGFPIFPLFDLHLSYRSITSKIKGKDLLDGTEVDVSGNVTGIGIMFNF